MIREETVLKDRSQTGDQIKWLAKTFYNDLGKNLELSLPQFHQKIRQIPYAEDLEDEVTARPAYLLDPKLFPALDCKKKAVLIASYLEGTGNEWRLVANSERDDEIIHHVFPQVKIDGEWYSVDATYDDMELYDAKPESTSAEELAGMKLVTLYGKPKLGAPQYQFSLFSMSGNNDGIFENDPLLQINPNDLSDIDAGIQALYLIAKQNPGIRWGDLLPSSRMGKRRWWQKAGTSLKKGVINTAKWSAKTYAAAGDKLGEWGGDAIRLLTDKEVADGLGRYGAAAATGGTSEAAGSLFGGNINANSVLDFLGGLGKSSKGAVNQAAAEAGITLDTKTMLIGGIGLLGFMMLMKK